MDAELTVPAVRARRRGGRQPGDPAGRGAPARRNPDVALHEGLTSQDVLDTALMLLLQDAVAAVVDHLGRAVEALARLTVASTATRR